MDPDFALDELLRLARREDLDAYDVDRLRELIVGLDSWLHRGGFLPVRWRCQRWSLRDQLQQIMTPDELADLYRELSESEDEP